MYLKTFYSLVTLALMALMLSSCKKDEADDFGGPTAEALDHVFAAGFLDDKLIDVSIDHDGNMYVTSKTRIFKVDATGNATVFAGSGTADVIDGQGTSAAFQSIDLLVFDDDNNLYVNDYHYLRKISPDGVVTSIVLDNPSEVFLKDYDDRNSSPPPPPAFSGLLVHNDIIYAGQGYIIMKIRGSSWNEFAGGTEQGFADGKGDAARMTSLQMMIKDPAGEDIIFSDGGSLRRITIADSTVTTIAGSADYGVKDGTVDEASFQPINDMVIGNNGNYYLSTSNSIRKITPDGKVTTVAGPIKSDGYPFSGGGIAISPDGQFIYVVDIGAAQNVKSTLIKIEVSKL